MKFSFIMVLIGLALSGCGSMGKFVSKAPAPDMTTVLTGDARPVQSHSLSSEQQKVVSDGVREMVAKVTVNGGESAKLSGFKAFTLPPRNGVHICGDVSYQSEPGKPELSAPYYLELEDQAGPPVAKRGQVGFDKLKKSKVIFMCRHTKKI